MDAVKETEIQTEICKYLLRRNAFFWRQNTTPIWDKKLRGGYGGYRGMGTFAMKGVSDIIVIDDYGGAIFIEVKTKRGKLNSDQLLFKKRCERHNAQYFAVSSVEEVMHIFEK